MLVPVLCVCVIVRGKHEGLEHELDCLWDLLFVMTRERNDDEMRLSA